MQRGHEVNAFAWQRRERQYVVDGVTVDTGLRGNSYSKVLAADADVIVSHCGDGGDGARLAATVGKPSVRMAHGGGPHHAMGADLVVYNSESLREASDWDGPSIVVHPHVDPVDYATTPGDAITLVNLSAVKGGDLFDRVTRSLPGRQFLGVRGGYGAQIIPRHRNVDVIAPMQNMRDDVYARTRILMMPSMYETWGMVGVEAMASGIPVIAHPTPGLRESLGDAGIFVDRNDVYGWIDAIARLDDPNEYKAASERSLKRSAELAGLDHRDRFADAVEALANQEDRAARQDRHPQGQVANGERT